MTETLSAYELWDKCGNIQDLHGAPLHSWARYLGLGVKIKELEELVLKLRTNFDEDTRAMARHTDCFDRIDKLIRGKQQERIRAEKAEARVRFLEMQPCWHPGHEETSVGECPTYRARLCSAKGAKP